MKTALMMTLCIAQLSAGARAVGADLVASTGKEGGSYYGIGLRLQSALAAEHQEYIDVVTSVGSLENLERLDDPRSRVNVGFSQTDALNRYLEAHPGFADEFIVLGDVGRECVFIVAGRGGSIESGADLKKDAGYEISVGDPSGGAAITYEYMSQLEPGFRNTPAVFIDTMEALLQVKVGGRYTSPEAAMIVQRPLRRSPSMQVVLDDPDAYRFVSISEDDMRNAQLPDGSVVYTFEKVAVGGKKRREPISVETICTRGLVLGAKPKLGGDLRGLLSKVMLESGSQIIGEDE